MTRNCRFCSEFAANLPSDYARVDPALFLPTIWRQVMLADPVRFLLTICCQIVWIGFASKSWAYCGHNGCQSASTFCENLSPICWQIARILLTGFRTIEVIGVYYGQKKPTSANDYLRKFVNELKSVIDNGFIYENRLIKVRLSTIISHTAQVDTENVRRISQQYIAYILKTFEIRTTILCVHTENIAMSAFF